MVDVLIIGAGPTGLMMAAQLLRQGVSCRIIDKNPQPSIYSKALLVQVRTLEIFQQMDLIEEVVTAGQKSTGIQFTLDNKVNIKLNLEEVESPYPFPLVLEQSETERILIQHLLGKGVTVERSVELLTFTQTKAKVFAVLGRADGGQERATCKYLIGCDGAHSTVRHTLGLSFDGHRYDEEFIVADVKMHSSASRELFQSYVSTHGAVLLLPMKGDQHFRLILIKKNREKPTPSHPTLEEVDKIAKSLLPFSFVLKEAYWTSCFTVSCRSVKDYHKGRVFLAGDAAHIHSPAGGQGMNTGLQDAYNLAWKLGLVLHEQAKPELLDSYQAERHPVAVFLLKHTDRLFRAMVESGFWVRIFRRLVAPQLIKWRYVRRKIANVISQVSIRYRHSPIVLDTALGNHKGPVAGDRAPDVQLLNTSQQATQLYDILKAPCHILFLLSGPHCREKDFLQLIAVGEEIRQTYKKQIKVMFVEAIEKRRANIPWKGDLWVDAQAAFHKRYGFSRSGLLLIRPDGHIGLRADHYHIDAVKDYCKAIFEG